MTSLLPTTQLQISVFLYSKQLDAQMVFYIQWNSVLATTVLQKVDKNKTIIVKFFKNYLTIKIVCVILTILLRFLVVFVR